jgi:hypothetical protein
LENRIMEKAFREEDEDIMDGLSDDNFKKTLETIREVLRASIKEGKYLDSANFQIEIADRIAEKYAELGKGIPAALTVELRDVLAENSGAFLELDRLYAERMRVAESERAVGGSLGETGGKFGRMGS